MNYYLDALQKFAVFSGRATRPEYWYFVLFNVLVSIALLILGFVVTSMTSGSVNGMLILDVYALATLLPSLGVTVRRLNDAGLSPWLILLAFVPIGNIVLLVLLCKESQPVTA